MAETTMAFIEGDDFTHVGVDCISWEIDEDASDEARVVTVRCEENRYHHSADILNLYLSRDMAEQLRRGISMALIEYDKQEEREKRLMKEGKL